jgi:hypothetical protein
MDTAYAGFASLTIIMPSSVCLGDEPRRIWHLIICSHRGATSDARHEEKEE